MKLYKFLFIYSLFFLFILSSFTLNTAYAVSWRIKVHNAAVVENDIVTLGDIAEPLGSISHADWNKLSQIQLFAAPTVEGKAFQISKKKLEESLHYVLGESASYLILPNSLAIQKKGDLLRDVDIMRLVENSLRPHLVNLNGKAELVDYRVPPFIFLPIKGQRIELDPIEVKPGRLSLKFTIKELDNSTVRRLTGTVFLNLWKNVPVPIRPYNRGDMLSVDNLTFVTKNVSNIRGEIWDGKGGPWQLNSAIGVDEPILESNLSPLATIRKGQLVKVYYNKGNVSVSQQGEALQDGALGDVINVRNVQSKKNIFGTVIDSQTVRIN